ncbi:hypothetical protein Tco_0030839 [Tanacetum coccineum]
MVNVISPDYVDDVPVVELNQHDDVPVVPEPVLVDGDEDPKEEEFEEEEEPQEEKDDIEFDIEKDENEPYVEQGTAAMEKLVEKLGNAEEKAEYKKLKKELEEARFRNTFLRDLFLKNDQMRLSIFWLKMRRVLHLSREDLLVILSSLVSVMESVDAAIAAERARHANAGNDARGSGPVRGQDAAPIIRECTFARFMKCNPTVFHDTKGAVELRRWFEKTKSVFGISECAEGKKVKFATATLQVHALTWWNAKVANIGLETMNQMPCTEMKQLMTA